MKRAPPHGFDRQPRFYMQLETTQTYAGSQLREIIWKKDIPGTQQKRDNPRKQDHYVGRHHRAGGGVGSESGALHPVCRTYVERSYFYTTDRGFDASITRRTNEQKNDYSTVMKTTKDYRNENTYRRK